MANKWTEDQQAVIDARGCDMLVAASAGSGKTAVLVERIIKRVTDPVNPIDIDRCLIVTFTNAAAGEMRERIRSALTAKAEAEPDNENLIRQMALLHHAQITTIHSFALEVIRSHFHEAEIDPSFRIGDEGEMKLLQQDVVEKLLEDEYKAGDENFLNFADFFVRESKSDLVLETMILNFFSQSQAYPWPQEWRQMCLQPYRCETVEELLAQDWMMELPEYVRTQTDTLIGRIGKAVKICELPDGPWMYAENLEDDLTILQALKGRLDSSSDYRGCSAAFEALTSFSRLSSKKDDSVSETLKEQVKGIRDKMKKSLAALQETCLVPAEDVLRQQQALLPVMEELVRLAGEFEERFTQTKREKNLVDFNDLEHLALKILVDRRDGESFPTAAAREYEQQYEEIMTDEYQDSNLVQEMMLTSISGADQGQHHRFMVGDVKQSIYRFRQARPELFNEKFRRFDLQEGPERLFLLQKNFRSDPAVLEFVNDLFERIMVRSVGDIDYDEAAMLKAGRTGSQGRPVILLTSTDVEEEQEGSAQKEQEMTEGSEADSSIEADKQEPALSAGERTLLQEEALNVAQVIRQVVGKRDIPDKSGGTRKVEWSDVAVLLRSMTGVSDVFAEVFAQEGIPAWTGTGSGYFSALEVCTVLDFLRILDNPHQDIPLGAVLRSAMVGLSDDELAAVRIEGRECDFYDAASAYLGSHTDAAADKLVKFFALLEDLRGLVPSTPMHSLLWEIYERTGYLDYVTALPAGGRRRANLEMLVEKAAAFESGSYRGLFNFIRYIEKLRKYDVDFSQAAAGSEAGGSVSITSIHKSKGLEYPVVFVCGMGRQFNQQDSRATVVFHPTMGAALDYVDPQLRVKVDTVIKKSFGRKIRLENLGEELRVLYVALTRPRELLFVSGAVSKLQDKMTEWESQGAGEGTLAEGDIQSAKCFLDWIMPALAGNGLQDKYEVRVASGTAVTATQAVTEEAAADTTVSEATAGEANVSADAGADGTKALQDLLTADRDKIINEEVAAYIRDLADQTYSHESAVSLPGKVSVSELKKKGMEEAEDEVRSKGLELFPQETDQVPVPSFRKEEGLGGAARGTLYHHIMEILDFSAFSTGTTPADFVDAQLEMLVGCGIIQKDDLRQLKISRISRFFESDLARRMAKADRRGQLHKEAPFVIAVNANEIHEEWPGDEKVLIQGIIDAWFEEDGQIVLMDYKSDLVPGKDPQYLVTKYRIQLDLYARALKRLIGKKVKETLIYSFSLGEQIGV